LTALGQTRLVAAMSAVVQTRPGAAMSAVGQTRPLAALAAVGVGQTRLEANFIVLSSSTKTLHENKIYYVKMRQKTSFIFGWKKNKARE
jgi:hypothetical protein